MSAKAHSLDSDFRFERKFVTEMSPSEVRTLIRVHPTIFVKAYPSRFINSLYFDSLDRSNYFDHVNGLGNRAKLRIRWYGELFGWIEEPLLEIKARRGTVGRKERYPLIPFRLDASMRIDSLLELLTDEQDRNDLVPQLESMEPSLVTRYRREYFRSQDSRFRLTVDSELKCYEAGRRGYQILKAIRTRPFTIIELKYDVAQDEEVARIANLLPARMTRYSKYRMGIESTRIG